MGDGTFSSIYDEVILIYAYQLPGVMIQCHDLACYVFCYDPIQFSFHCFHIAQSAFFIHFSCIFFSTFFVQE